MNYENPELQPPQHKPENALAPEAPDFAETPDIAPLESNEKESLPVWLYLVCGFFLFMAGSSFTGFDVFGSGLYDQGPGGPVLSSNTTETAKVTDPVELGKKVYNNNCANCHHADGEGQPGTYPPMGGSELVIGPKDRLAAVLLHGLNGPLNGVRGGSYGTAQMPGWGTALTDEKISQVMTYIRASFGNKADAATEAEVTAARTQFASQSSAYTQAEVLKIGGAAPEKK